METIYSKIIELLQDFIRSREYLSENLKQKLELEIKFNSDLSELREVIQDAEERIKEYESQESCAGFLSDIKDALTEVMEMVEGLEVEGLEMKKEKKQRGDSEEHKKFKYTWPYLDRGCYENHILLPDGTIKNIKKE